MVFRFMIILLGVIMFPNMGYSIIPTLDCPGTFTAGNEVAQSLNTVKSSTESMNFLQKTSAAIGTFQKNVSEYASDMQEKIQKKLEKLEKYKEQVEEYKAQVMAYKAQAEEVVNKAKNTVDQAKGYYNQAQDAVDQAKGYYNQAKDAVETAKSTVEGVKDQVESGIDQAKSAAEAVKNRVEEGIDKAESVVNKNSDSAEKSEEQEVQTSTRQEFITEDMEKNNVVAEDISVNNDETVDVVIPVTNDEPVVGTIMDTENSQNEDKRSTTQPTRSSFETSFGYGKYSTSSVLAFAKIEVGLNIKTGETPEGVLVVPRALSVFCELDYEKAAKKDEKGEPEYSKCLKKLNDMAYSTGDDVSAEQRENAKKDLANSYLELLAAQYFEGLEIYNESFHFKNNEVDPIINSEVTNVRDAWQYAKEMNQIVGSRINIFNKINSRALVVKGLGLYYFRGMGSTKD